MIRSIPVQVSGWQNARIEPESFDIVTANHVVEHFRTPFPALVRFRDWLKPKGYLHISVPDVYSPQRTPYGRWFRRMGRLGGEMFQATFVPGNLDRGNLDRGSLDREKK